jgi:hypothetical protein
VNFTGPVVLQHGQQAYRREHHGQTCALCRVLSNTKEGDHAGNEDQSATHTDETRSHTCEGADGKKDQKGLGIHGELH